MLCTRLSARPQWRAFLLRRRRDYGQAGHSLASFRLTARARLRSASCQRAAPVSAATDRTTSGRVFVALGAWTTLTLSRANRLSSVLALHTTVLNTELTHLSQALLRRTKLTGSRAILSQLCGCIAGQFHINPITFTSKSHR